MNSIAPSSKAARQTLDDDLDPPQSRGITARPDQDSHWHVRIGDSREALEIDPASLVSSVPSILMARSNHRFSTIIPVFNGARYLGEAIESVMAQTHPALDVIVVDDGSTDGSAAVAQSFGDRVFTVRQQNLGQAAALNAGLAWATGEYVAFLDADDLWEPEKAARQIDRFAARADLSYCVTRMRNFLSPEFESHRAELSSALFQDMPGYCCSALMTRRSVFDELGGFDTGLRHANKTAWFLRARDHGAVGEEIGEVLVHRRLHADNFSQAHAQRSLDEYLRLVKQSLDRHRRVSPG